MFYKRMRRTQLGLSFKLVNELEQRLRIETEITRPGPKHRHKMRFILLMVLMRLRTSLPLRLMSSLFCINHVTLWRWCKRVTDILAQQFEPRDGTIGLIVDTTSTRVRSTDRASYTAYKKMHVSKVQVLCDATGRIHHVSGSYPGSVHDKTIWNKEVSNIPNNAHVLADKAYAGADGENTILFRPIKRNEQRWKDDPEAAKAANRVLSKQRVKIEHVFAQLKTWRTIHHDYPNRPETYGTTFKAIAYLHNLELDYQSKRN